ncbi:MAG: hypothetical protein IKE24_06395 [Clostridia bacterium]|nr:hypothetical protein [Clostridia bacterium]
MKQGRKAICLLALLCMCIQAGPALADWQIEMTPGENWSWEAGGISEFSGVIRSDGADVAGAVLTLSVDTRMEDSGSVVFTNLNGKKVKIRKRSDTAEEDLSGGNAENTFEGEWTLPDEVEEGLASAVVRLTVSDAGGNELARSEMQVGSAAADEASAEAAPAEKLDRLILILLLCGCGIWALALGRFALLRRRAAKSA